MDTSIAVMRAVTRLQSLVRRRNAKKVYGELLFEKYLKEEEAASATMHQELEREMRFLERKKTERDLLDESLLEKAKKHEKGLSSTGVKPIRM